MVYFSMDGSIDFHSHVLPNMDDGSDSFETSLSLLRRLTEQGISTVCATSHYYRKREPTARYLDRRAAALEALMEHWKPDLPKLLLGAEVAFFPGIGEEETLSQLCLPGTRTLLLEMPFTRWPTSSARK